MEKITEKMEERVETKKKTSWVRMDVNWWPTIAAEMPRPWTRAAVLMDLRWWADQEQMGRVKRPGRPALCKRWGWSEWQARQAMKDVVAWEDPMKASLQPASSPPPAAIQDPTTKPLESQGHPSSVPPASLQPASSRADLHTTHTHNTELVGAKAPMSDKDPVGPCPDEPEVDHEAVRLEQLWGLIQRLRKEHLPKARTQKLTDRWRSSLKARVKDSSHEELIWTVKWWLTSPASRAVYLREHGYGLSTLLRPSSFQEYLDLASAENQAAQDLVRSPLPAPGNDPEFRSTLPRSEAMLAAYPQLAKGRS